MAKKLSTQDILAAARKQDQSGSAPAETPPAASAPAPSSPVSSAPEPEAASEAPAAPKSRPGSTKDILAAARAQSAGGGTTAPKPTAAGAAPKSTKDILAAARAQQSGAAAGAPATPAAAKAKPAAKATPAATGGDKPSVKDMLKAVREGAPAAEEAKGPVRKPVSPAARAKAVAAEKSPKDAAPPRRNFLVALIATPFAAAWTFFVLTSSVSLLAMARFMMPNVLVEPPSKFKIGPPGDYPVGQVSTKWTSQYGVWIVHADFRGQPLIYALASVCTHLGCTPNWLDGEQKFKCPCHGSGFYITGINFEGPAPRPLERVGLQIAEDGMLEVDKSVKFQEEMGQWQDPASYVSIA